MSAGVLLFAHGARDVEWSRPFEQVARELHALRPDVAVRLAYLEFMSPSMSEAGAELVQAGCSRIDIVPLFLGAGGHVRKDVPGLFAQLQAAHPGVRFTLHRAVGEAPTVIAAMAAAAATLIDDHSAFP
jgi:sirohydrochlorin cobaltochelatase